MIPYVISYDNLILQSLLYVLRNEIAEDLSRILPNTETQEAIQKALLWITNGSYDLPDLLRSLDKELVNIEDKEGFSTGSECLKQVIVTLHLYLIHQHEQITETELVNVPAYCVGVYTKSKICGYYKNDSSFSKFLTTNETPLAIFTSIAGDRTVQSDSKISQGSEALKNFYDPNHSGRIHFYLATEAVFTCIDILKSFRMLQYPLVVRCLAEGMIGEITALIAGVIRDKNNLEISDYFDKIILTLQVAIDATNHQAFKDAVHKSLIQINECIGKRSSTEKCDQSVIRLGLYYVLTGGSTQPRAALLACEALMEIKEKIYVHSMEPETLYKEFIMSTMTADVIRANRDIFEELYHYSKYECFNIKNLLSK